MLMTKGEPNYLPEPIQKLADALHPDRAAESYKTDLAMDRQIYRQLKEAYLINVKYEKNPNDMLHLLQSMVYVGKRIGISRQHVCDDVDKIISDVITQKALLKVL